jgi:hypothetical protein
MKQHIFIFMLACIALLCPERVNAQAIGFSYDTGGHLVQRSVQVSNVRLSNPFHPGDTSAVKPLNFNIYPNPTNDQLTIEGKLPDNLKEAKIYLSDISGQILKTGTYTGESKQMLVSDLKEGMYLLEISYSKDNKSTYKIIITH